MRKKLTIFLSLIALTGAIFNASSHALPLPEHEVLKMDEGTWSAKLQFYSKGTVSSEYNWIENNEMLGELWSVGTLSGPLGDQQYKGFATLGYNPKTQKYVGTWVDSISPEILAMEGSYDFENKTLLLFYEVTKTSGEVEKRKNVMIYQSPEQRDFTMYVWANEQWIKHMTIDYRRISP